MNIKNILAINSIYFFWLSFALKLIEEDTDRKKF